MSAAASRREQISALPDLLETVARELRAGRNLHEAVAVGAADPLTARSGVGEVVALTAGGRRLADALDSWAAGLAHPDGDLLRAVLTLGAGTGGAMAEVAERAAATLRERVDLRDEVRALTAQIRVSAAMLAVAPPLFLLIAAAAEPSIVGVTLRSAAGRVMLFVGVGLDVAGFWWMQRLMAAVHAPSASLR